jgi:hypothetical protein
VYSLEQIQFAVFDGHRVTPDHVLPRVTARTSRVEHHLFDLGGARYAVLGFDETDA